jgi:hypothetical protein
VERWRASGALESEWSVGERVERWKASGALESEWSVGERVERWRASGALESEWSAGERERVEVSQHLQRKEPLEGRWRAVGEPLESEWSVGEPLESRWRAVGERVEVSPHPAPVRHCRHGLPVHLQHQVEAPEAGLGRRAAAHLRRKSR